MKVRMKTLITGTLNGRRWPGIGETVEVPDDIGADVCANGYAEPVAQKPEAKVEKRTTCAGTTAAGDPCSNKAGDDGYCHLHSE